MPMMDIHFGRNFNCAEQTFLMLNEMKVLVACLACRQTLMGASGKHVLYPWITVCLYSCLTEGKLKFRSICPMVYPGPRGDPWGTLHPQQTV